LQGKSSNCIPTTARENFTAPNLEQRQTSLLERLELREDGGATLGHGGGHGRVGVELWIFGKAEEKTKEKHE
jgi:hypothetical protein